MVTDLERTESTISPSRRPSANEWGMGIFHHGSSGRRNGLGDLKNINLELLRGHTSGSVSRSMWV